MSNKLYLNGKSSENSKKPKLYTHKRAKYEVAPIETERYSIADLNGSLYDGLSYDAYDAIINDKLDTYTPKGFEKSTIEKYKSTPQFVLETGEFSRYGQGNIDLYDRPIYKNADGSISTVRSMSFNEDGKEILIPTIVKDENGKAKLLTDEQAIEHYHKTGEYLGKFDTVEQANSYAQSLHENQNQIYNANKISYNALKALQNFEAETYKSDDVSEQTTINRFLQYKKFQVKDTKGNYIGDVSYDGYKALMKGDINYKSGDETENRVISLYFAQPMFPLEVTTDDGEVLNFGNVNAEWLKIIEGGLTSQMIEDMQKSNSNDEVSQTLKKFAEYCDSLDEPKGFREAVGNSVGYIFEKVCAGLTDSIFDVVDVIAGTIVKAGTGVTFGSWRDNLNELSDYYFSKDTYGDDWSASAESRYKVPDLIREYGGDMAFNFGSMLPSVIAEVATAGVSPALDVQLARSMTTASSSSVKTALKSFSSKLVKPTAGDIVLFSTASSSAAKEGYKATGDFTQAISYGVLNGLGELATEKLLNGYAATKYGKSTALIDVGNTKIFKTLGKTKLGQTLNNKYVNKLGDVMLEGVEELMMASAEPVFRKLTIEPNLNLTQELVNAPYAESFLQGVLLSAFSNATFATLGKISNYVPTMSKVKKVKELNAFAEGINKLLPDSAKVQVLNKFATTSQINARVDELNRLDSILMLNDYTNAINAMVKKSEQMPLLEFNSTEQEITQRRKEVEAFGDLYSALLVEEVIENNPGVKDYVVEKAENQMQSDSVTVGTVFQDTQSGRTMTVVSRDGANTVLEVADENGNVGQRTYNNAELDKGIASGRIVNVSAVATPTTSAPKAVAENATTTPTSAEARTISLTRVGDSYELYGKSALALAEQLDMETTRKVVNGVETDVLVIPESFAEDWANAMAEDGYTINFSDKPSVSATPTTENKNEVATDEVATTDKTVSSEEKGITDKEMDVICNAMEETLTPQAKEDLQNGEVRENYVRIANALIKLYNKKGTITEDFGAFFTDGGKAVDEAIGSAFSETTAKAETETAETQETAETEVSQRGMEVGDEYYFPDQKRTYKVTEKSEKSTTFDVTNEDGSTTTKKMSNNLVEKHFTDDKRVDKSSEPKVLKNEQESDTIDSTKESNPAEREDNGNEGRSDSLSRDGRRESDGSTRKQNRKLFSFERKNKGKDAKERYSIARELINRGQVEKTTIDNHSFNQIKTEAYNDDMQAMVEVARAKGVELVFFVGEGTSVYTKADGTKVNVPFKGLKLNAKQVFVRYDHRVSPQKIAKHETIHAKWFSDEFQGVKDAVLGSLTEEAKQNILAQPRYAEYKELHNSEEIALEEFVCDVMAGMNDYTADYIDTVNDYWYGSETVDNYKVAEYTESIDAGGEDTAKSKHKYTTKDLQKISSKNKQRYSLSSMGATFFGDESISSEEFEKMLEDGSYKKHKGYIDYVKDCVKVYKQSRGIKDMLPGSEVKKIEQQIEGIMRVAIAAKKAGYDIFDDGETRTKKDSKKRLLFSSLEPNSDYVTSSDVSTICDKAKNFTEIHDAIIKLEEERGVPDDQRFFKNIDNYFILHKLLANKGLTIPCDECYVQSMRKNLTPMADAFRQLVQEENPNNKDNEQLYHKDGKDKGNIKKNNAEIRNKVRELCSSPDCPIKLEDLTVQMLTTADGLATLRCQAPLLYETFNSFYGQSKPKMPREATPFRPGELIAMFTNSKGQIKNGLVNKIKSTGGFRLQSYSDFQIKNFVDVLQTIFEASMVGLNGHAYTKVPAFLEATEGTNLKRNISIFMYEDGGDWKLDKKNSFPMELEDIYALVATDESGNTSIIAVSQNESMSAWIMANDNVGYGIPFHKSGTRMEVVRGRIVKTPDGREILGYANQKDHTKQQTEVWKTTVGDNKENTKVKKPIDIYKFWDFKNKDNLSKKELIEKNLKRYIDECNKNNYRPKFREYLIDNESVLNETLKYAKELGFVSQDATIDDISFKYDEYTIPYGYYKFLGDFGMFNAEGKASPIEVLSLENYNFDKAVDFFKDSSKLRINELLQQFENGEVRDRYRKMVENG